MLDYHVAVQQSWVGIYFRAEVTLLGFSFLCSDSSMVLGNQFTFVILFYMVTELKLVMESFFTVRANELVFQIFYLEYWTWLSLDLNLNLLMKNWLGCLIGI